MKKPKKALLIAYTFAVALNLNGCVYGPPPVDEDTVESKEVIEESIVDTDSSQGEEPLMVESSSD
jgi:starvation-inducible outer membrane lipoprotein